jgi:protein-tyrosine-phosphatase
MKTLLFLCTGNYYRSRLAEELFNHLAPHAGLRWIAQSRALAIERGIGNVGSLAPFVIRVLEERGLAARGANRPSSASGFRLPFSLKIGVAREKRIKATFIIADKIPPHTVE